jgi:hypothetical protein
MSGDKLAKGWVRKRVWLPIIGTVGQCRRASLRAMPTGAVMAARHCTDTWEITPHQDFLWWNVSETDEEKKGESYDWRKSLDDCGRVSRASKAARCVDACQATHFGSGFARSKW